MSLKGICARTTVDASPTIRALRDLVANLDAAHSAGMAHLLGLQRSESIASDDLEVTEGFATWVYYGSDIPESIARLRTAIVVAKKGVA